MASRRYLVYDVFTDRSLAGNPLAIVLDADGLDTAAMQAIAAEFNLSETVFVLPPERPGHRARIRIFTPRSELPFAGHPTVGTAVALFEAAGATGDAALIVLEETVGPVRCVVDRADGGAAFAEFDLPRLPERLELSAEPAMLAAALGLAPDEIGFENHRPAAWTAGVPYVLVPVRDLAAAGRARMDMAAWLDLAPTVGSHVAAAYVYCRETVRHDAGLHARMFAPHDGIAEDPATGSAVAALAGQIVACDAPVDGPCRLWIEQGVEMGRPSAIRLEIDVAGGTTAAARIGGHAVKVAEGVLQV